MRDAPNPDEITVVTDLLDQISAGRGLHASLFTADARLDAVVPNWRLAEAGAEAVSRQLSTWYGDPGTFEELSRQPSGTGEIVEYTLRWEEGGVPHASRQTHHLTVVDGRISLDRVWCGGRWPASLLAEMEAVTMASGR